MNYKLQLIPALIAIAAMPLAHANFPLPSAQDLNTAFVTVILAMTAEVGVVVFLLRKKSLRLIKLSIVLFLANIISFFLFILILPTLFLEPPVLLIFLSEMLVILFEAYVLAGTSKGSYFRKPGGLPIEFKGAFKPILIGNIVSIVVGMCILLILVQNPIGWPLSTSPGPPWVEGQGTWETTLEARDFDGDTSTIEGYYDTVLRITWLADANYAKSNGDYADSYMKWTEANAWAARLDINGVTGWRLPKLSPINGITFDGIHSNDATTDNGHAPTTTDGSDGGWRDSAGNPVSEMGHMYYVTLGNNSRCSPDYNDRCVEQSGYELYNTGTFSPFNAGTFFNVQSSSYWTSPGTDFNPNLVTAFIFSNGEQGFYNDIDGVAFAWAVHDGDVGTPIPKWIPE